MRKHALVLTMMVALASGSAFALGDRAKDKKATDKAPATQTTPSSSSGYTTPGSMAPANPDRSSGVIDKKKQVANNDSRCDESKYSSKALVPKDCYEKQGTGAAAASSTTGQSGGDAAGTSGGSASSSSPSSSSSSAAGK